MHTSVPHNDTAKPQNTIHTRMSEILDAAAKASDVPPDEFRAAIREAMQYADSGSTGSLTADDTPETFVLSLVRRLF